DYFLSSDRLELPHAQEHYTERLICFPNVPHFFRRPEPHGTTRRRDEFPLPADARWYVCQQTLFKMHPAFDSILEQILKCDPRGIVILFEGQQPDWKRLLMERFRRAIPDVADRIVFLPRMSFDDYLGFLPLGDVLIDSIHFSGGTTVLQTMA